MHDIRDIRANPERYFQGLRRRGEPVALEPLLELDRQRREGVTALDQMRQTRNSVSKEINAIKKSSGDSSCLETQMRELGERIKSTETCERNLDNKIRELLLVLPNLPSDSTPDGAGSEGNVVVREVDGVVPMGGSLLDHLQLADHLEILDFKRGAKVAGSGFPVWSGWGALLERALINFMLDLHTKEHGYTEMMTPLLASYTSMLSSGQIPKLEADMYRCRRSEKDEGSEDDLFLIPTSEVTLVNLHRDEILDGRRLPLKYAAYSPCFRREAASYGHMTRGFLRVHQFNKVELVRFEKPETSIEALEELVFQAEEVLRRLELKYRVIELCSGDMGFNAAKCYDLEVWAPVEKQWLEVSSCSNCEAFQARRAGIKFRPRGGGKTDYVHTLNGSGVATSRLIVALLETYQTDERTLMIPSVLRSYMRGMTQICKPSD